MEKNNFAGFFYRPIFGEFFYPPPSTSLISAGNQKKVNTHISFYPVTIPSVSYFLIKITSLFIHPSLYSSICMSTPVSVFPQQCHQNFTPVAPTKGDYSTLYKRLTLKMFYFHIFFSDSFPHFNLTTYKFAPKTPWQRMKNKTISTKL